MNLTDLLIELKKQGIYLYLNGDELRCKAPLDRLNIELKQSLKKHKIKLIDYLSQRKVEQDDGLFSITRETQLPLSYSQERLWFLDEFERGGTAYNMSGALRLEGKLDIAVLEQSLNEIIQRHEVLRTTFVAVDGKPQQIIADTLELLLNKIDLSHIPEISHKEEVKKYLQVESQHSFVLSQGPLVRATLLLLGQSSSSHKAEYILIFTMHHIISDGWSIAILVREFISLYEAHRSGQSSSLPDLALQYADYSIWQRQWLQGERLIQQVDYWKNQLAGAPAVLELPTDCPRPAVQSYRGATRYDIVPANIVEPLKRLARQHDATLFMVLMAAFNVVLSRYSGQTDICVGTPVANRNRVELEGLIGFFVNTLVLRSDLSGNPTFIELLERVKVICLDAQAHQDLPFEKLVEELSPARDMDHNPLFQVMLALQNTPETKLAIEELEIEPILMEAGTAKFDLDLEITQTEHGLKIQYCYSTDLFDASTIERLVQHYRVLLEEIGVKAEQPISALSLFSETEKKQLVAQCRGDKFEYPRDGGIHQLFEEQVEKHPGAIAVCFEAEQLTYQELNNRANQLAHYLRVQGVGTETLVAICVERSVEMMVGILGILKAGGAYLPIDTEAPPERIKQILQDAGVKWVLTLSTLAVNLPEFCQILCLDQEIGTDYCAESLKKPIFYPQQLAYLLYTSGTTGQPKGVSVTHASLVNQYYAWQSSYQLNHHQVHLQMARYTFDVFSGDWVRALCSGAQLVICPRDTLLQPEKLCELLQQKEISVAEFVPSVLRLLGEYLEQSGNRLAFMQLLICGSDRWYAEEYLSFLKWCALDTRLINSYGLTETTIDSTYFETRDTESLTQELVPIGKQFANTDTYVLDRWLNLVPQGTAGELYIGGAGITRGYVNRSDLTAERFIPNPFNRLPGERLYKTGDVVRYRTDGNIEHLGRTDHQVKLRGFRIELGEIEATLLQHPQLKAAVVVMTKDPSGGQNQHLIAYVVGKTEGVEQESLRMHVKAQLPDYMVPTVFIELAQLPVNANGKVDRKSLPGADLSNLNTSSYAAPRTPTEQAVVDIWCEVLGVEKVGIHDNFFKLGGHSLLAMILVERMRQKGLNAEVRSLFTTKTLAEFVVTLNTGNHVEVPDNLIPENCIQITPEMLPLVALKQSEINNIISHVPSGVKNIQDIYPLTPFQEGILFHHLMSTEGDAYVLSSVLAFDKRESLQNFLDALQAVINRHDILRTAVLWEELSVPVQVVLREVTLPIIELALNSVLGDIAQQLREKFNPNHFRLDIRQAPLLQTYMAWDAQHSRWLLLILEHHLALDHVAMEAVLNEVKVYLTDQFAELLPPLPFRNFVAQVRLGEQPENHKIFFKKLLGNVDEPTAPFDLLDVQGDGSEIVERSLDLDEVMNQSISMCAKSAGVSAASIFHLVWAKVLSLICGKDTVVFGTVLFGRTQSEKANQMLGMFINTLPVRFDIDNTSCKDAVKSMHHLLAELMLYEHASLALAQKCSAVSLPTPLFSTLLNYRHSVKEDNAHIENGALLWKNLGIEILIGQERTNYPVTLSVDDFGNSYRLTLQTQSAIDPIRVLGYLKTGLAELVRALRSNSNSPLCDINLLPEAEKNKLLKNCNRMEPIDLDSHCIHQLFEEQVEKYPQAIAVCFEGEQLTYQELNSRSNQLAHYLRAQGVGAETLVGICVERSVEMVVGILGILKAGGAYLPLDPDYPKERIEFILHDAYPSVVLVHERTKGIIPADITTIDLVGDTNTIAQLSPHNLNSEIHVQNLAYVIYTSGSTGNPKGVMVTHYNIWRLFVVTEKKYRFDNKDVWSLFHSYAFDFSVWEIWGALIYGGRLVIVPNDIRYSMEDFHQFLETEGITVLNQTPSVFYQLKQIDAQLKENYLTNKLRLIIFGGEALDFGQLHEWFDHHGDTIQLVNMYGITETTVHVTWAFLTKQIISETSSSIIGNTLPDLQAFILDHYGNLVPIGVTGELYIGGSGLSRGYMNRAELTAERFVPNLFDDKGGRLYRTGDLARYRADGAIEYLGRNDHQVKIRGFRIELGEIEAVLAQHPEINGAVVVAREDRAGDKRLVAYIVGNVLEETETQLTEHVRRYLREHLPEYMVPTAFVFLERLPLTPNGKVDRKSLPNPDISIQIDRQYIAPRNEIEEIVAELCAEVLGIERVGIHDNFFELGGHSLLATRLVTKIRMAFDIEFSLSLLFRSTTIAQLCELIEQAIFTSISELSESEAESILESEQYFGTK